MASNEKHPLLERATDALTGRDTWTLVLLVVSLMAAGVSFYATYHGFAQYASDLVALLLSVAVQGGLLALAWLIGAATRSRRPLLVGLYACTMMFSVVFSYVFFHSVLASTAKTQETRTALVDTLRQRKATLEALVEEGRSGAAALSTALQLWTADEARYGRTTFDCAAREEPYLAKLCGEIDRRVRAWEERTGSGYEVGSGEGLRYRILRSEAAAMDSVEARLAAADTRLKADSTLATPTHTNRELLAWYDGLRSQVPVSDLEKVLGRDVTLPSLPRYREFADPRDSTEDNPFASFHDLAAFVDLITGKELPLSRQMAIFALLLAIFIDGFVLAVAIGGGRPTEEGSLSASPFASDGPGELRAETVEALDDWTRTATLGEARSEEARARFLSEVFDSIRHRGGHDVFVPDTVAQRRFASLLASAGFATLRSNGRSGGEDELFLLEDRTMTVLSRYFSHLSEPGDRSGQSDDTNPVT